MTSLCMGGNISDLLVLIAGYLWEKNVPAKNIRVNAGSFGVRPWIWFLSPSPERFWLREGRDPGCSQ